MNGRPIVEAGQRAVGYAVLGVLYARALVVIAGQSVAAAVRRAWRRL